MTTLFPPTHLLNARMLDAVFNGAREAGCGTDCTVDMTPRADVLESDKEFRILMEMPGVQNDGLDINLENQSLTVKATRDEAVPEGFETRRHERSGQARFNRTFTLGNAVDSDRISAKLENGVLLITLPKSDAGLVRRIEVQ